MTDPYLEALLEAQQQIKFLIVERDEARAALPALCGQYSDDGKKLWVDHAATARKQALAEAEDFVRRHGEEELADGIAALTQSTAKGEGE
jgi:hypothetical protein